MLCEICGIFDGGTWGSGGLRGNTGCSLRVLCRWARGDLHSLGKEEGGRHGNGFWRVHGSSRTTLRDGCCESRNAFRRGDFTEMTGVLPQRRARMSWTRGTRGECGLGRRCALCCSHRRPDYDDHRKSFRHSSWPPHFFYDKARQVQPTQFVLRVHRVSRERKPFPSLTRHRTTCKAQEARDGQKRDTQESFAEIFLTLTTLRAISAPSRPTTNWCHKILS